MVQIFSSKPTEEKFVVGDKVMWKGIGPLTVVEVNGDIVRAYSLTMQLTVDSHDQLIKAEE